LTIGGGLDTKVHRRLTQNLILSWDETPMGRVERTREIARRRTRRAKLKKLRKKFAQAQTESEKADLRDKVRKMSPLVSLG
jgi:hypothetical protein